MAYAVADVADVLTAFGKAFGLPFLPLLRLPSTLLAFSPPGLLPLPGSYLPHTAAFTHCLSPPHLHTTFTLFSLPPHRTHFHHLLPLPAFAPSCTRFTSTHILPLTISPLFLLTLLFWFYHLLPPFVYSPSATLPTHTFTTWVGYTHHRATTYCHVHAHQLLRFPPPHTTHLTDFVIPLVHSHTTPHHTPPTHLSLFYTFPFTHTHHTHLPPTPPHPTHPRTPLRCPRYFAPHAALPAVSFACAFFCHCAPACRLRCTHRASRTAAAAAHLTCTATHHTTLPFTHASLLPRVSFPAPRTRLPPLSACIHATFSTPPRCRLLPATFVFINTPHRTRAFTRCRLRRPHAHFAFTRVTPAAHHAR